jgi:hypothetical protein
VIHIHTSTYQRIPSNDSTITVIRNQLVIVIYQPNDGLGMEDTFVQYRMHGRSAIECWLFCKDVVVVADQEHHCFVNGFDSQASGNVQVLPDDVGIEDLGNGFGSEPWLDSLTHFDQCVGNIR